MQICKSLWVPVYASWHSGHFSLATGSFTAGTLCGLSGRPYFMGSLGGPVRVLTMVSKVMLSLPGSGNVMMLKKALFIKTL